MPGRPHHTEKWKSCVEKVMAQGHTESSASAICTTSLQKAGEPIFEGAESRSAEEFRLLDDPLNQLPDARRYESFQDCVSQNKDKDDPEAYCRMMQDEGRMQPGLVFMSMRELHLCSAAGAPTLKMWDGRPHYVVPVVALMEGVIHAVNAEVPEFVTLAALTASASNWNGRPVMLGHPVNQKGLHIAANEPSVIEAQGIGTIFNTRVLNRKLLMDVYIDPVRLERMNRSDVLDAVKKGEVLEVSVGAHVFTTAEEGQFREKKYKARWDVIGPDHLAILPGGRGACSVEMGCGLSRAASYRVMEDDLEEIVDAPTKVDALPTYAPTIRHEGGKWNLYAKDGVRRLATHDTQAEVLERQQQINAAAGRRNRELTT